MKQILFLLLIGFSAFGQKNSNSVFDKKIIEIEILSKIVPDTALLKIDKLLLQIQNSKSEIKITKCYLSKAFIKINQTDLANALKWNQAGFAKSKKLKNDSLIAKAFQNYALIYQRKSDYVQSFDYFIKSSEVAQKANDFLLLQKNYFGMAMGYCDQQNLKKALFYAFKSLNLDKTTNNLMQKGYSLAGVAEVYRMSGDFKNANDYFEKSIACFKKLNDKHGVAWVLTNWSLLFENKYLIKSLEMELEAQKIWDNVAPENVMSMTNLGNLAWSYYEISRNDTLIKEYNSPIFRSSKSELLSKAEICYKKSIVLAKKKKNPNALYYNSANLADLQAYRGDYQAAFINKSLSSAISDSLYSQENKNNIARLESKREIDLKNIVIANNKKQKIYYLIGILLLSTIGILFYRQSKKRKTANQKLALLNAELDNANKIKTRFFGILNHDLRSPVSNLIHFLHLQKDNPDLLDEATKKRMEDKTILGAENLLSSMEDILLWSKGQMDHFAPVIKNIEVAKIFDDNKKVFSGYQNIKFTYENPENLVLKTDENYLKTIIRNLTSNAINVLDSSIPRNDTSTITWKVYLQNNKNYLSITDNGPGANQENFKALYDENQVVGIKSGLGLHLIRDLAKAINCEIEVDSKIGKGTTIVLEL